MLNLLDPRKPKPKCDGSSRREFLQVGALTLGGLTLPHLLQARARAAAEGRSTPNRSVILLFLDGGAPQHETFDPKPDAPREYRNVFGTVQTRLTGVRFGSHFPRMAAQADRMSVIRSLVHDDGDHGGATHW